MTARLVLWILLAAGGWGFSLWVYARRELPVRGRRGLALLRGGSLAVVLLLLLDPGLPGRTGPRGGWVLVDTSPSMMVPQGEAGSTAPPASSGLGEYGEARVASFGSPVTRLPTGWSGDGDPPGAWDSRLAPALTLALESGASHVRVVTDLRLDDPVEVEAILRDAPVPVVFRDLGGPVTNVGVEELHLPGAARAGSEVQGSATLFGAVPGPVSLALLLDGAAVWDTTLVLDGPGRTRVPVRLTAPGSAGPAAVSVRLLSEGDVHPGDDVRSRILEVDPVSGELVVVSWMPDWEPRFLLPVLEEVTGLRGQGYLRVGQDRFITMNGEVAFADGAEVAAALGQARLAVVHGLPADAGSPWAGVLARVPRLLVLPAGAAPGGEAGEWYLSAEVPPSPLAGEVAGVPALGLPPLLGRRPPESPRSGSVPGTAVLLLQRGGQGESVPALILREASDGTRRVEALAYGFWRWGFRDGPARELYRRLWSGAAGWLLAANAGGMGATGLVPSRSVMGPGEEVAWRAGGAAGATLSVAFTPRIGGSAGPSPPAPGSPVTVPVDSMGRAQVRVPDVPGVYRWDARSGGEAAEEAAGLLVVESADVDLLPPRAVHLPGLAVAAGEEAPGDGRPLRTHPVPYLLLLGLLTAEWAVRRRSGLR